MAAPENIRIASAGAVHGGEMNSIVTSPSITATAQDRLTRGSIGEVVVLDAAQTLPVLLDAQSARRPEAPALIFCDQVVSYAQLHARANQLARLLIAEGVRADDIVAVLLEPSVERVIAILAIIKAGAAYLPLDCEYPTERLQMMLADARPRHLLSTSAQLPAHGLSGQETICLDSAALHKRLQAINPAPLRDNERLEPLRPTHLAYVIYTSGSTGAPKGVEISHSAIINQLLWLQSLLQFSDADRVLQKTAIGFDVSVWEWALPLISGATLVICEANGRKDPNYLLRMIERHAVTVLHFVPSVLTLFLDVMGTGSCRSLRHVLSGGEALGGPLRERALRLLPHARLWNMYGPTETAIDVASWRCESAPETEPTPIGWPIWNTQIHLLDANLKPVADGVVGGLYIAGANLARGYLGRPDLTADRFIACPFGPPGTRMYQSGDLARRNADGAIMYLGRSDNQIKLHGIRIEPGEIEATLISRFGDTVAQAVVLIEHDPTPRIVAYLVPQPGATLPTLSKLRADLAASMPAYMVPKAFMFVPALPLLPSGKLNRKALPRITVTEANTAFRAPETAPAALLCTLFAEVTATTEVGLDDNFFAIGGDSLLAMRLIARLRQQTGKSLPLNLLFNNPTPGRLAPYLDALALDQSPALRASMGRLGPNSVVLSNGQRRFWAIYNFDPISSSYNVPIALSLHGTVDFAALRSALVALVTRHEALRTLIVEHDDGVIEGQITAPPDPTNLLPITDLSSLPEHEQTTRSKAWLEAEAAQPFRIDQDVPWRASLIVLSPDKAILAITLHHHATDGVSTGILADDLTRAYAAARRHRAPDWPALPVQCSDWAAWQQASLPAMRAEKINRARKRLGEIPAELLLPLDHPRNTLRAGPAGVLPVRLSAGLVAQLQLVAQRESASMFAMILAAYAATLGRLAGQGKVMIGSPVAGRTHAETERVIGFFVNTIVHAISLSDGCTGQQLIAQARDSVESALSDQDLPFEYLVHDLAGARSLAQTPLFQAMLAFQTHAEPAFRLDGLEVSPIAVPPSTAMFDVMLELRPTSSGELAGSLIYDAALFDEHSAAGWVEAFGVLTAALANAPGHAIATLPLLTPERRAALLAAPSHEPIGQTLPRLFAAQVERTPVATALVFGDLALSYAELAAQADVLAGRLHSLGIQPNDVIALVMERSPAMIIAMLGIVTSGAAYMPIDADYPAERISFMLADSSAKLILTTHSTAHQLRTQLDSGTLPPLLCIDDVALTRPSAAQARLPTMGADDLAYLIYTSGSTGQPKAVATTHANVCSLAWQPSYCAVGPGSVVLQFAPTTFDAATFEIWAALLNGATLALHPPGAADFEDIAASIRRHRVDVMWLTSGLFAAAVEAQPGMFAGVRQLLIGGDVVSPQAVGSILSQHRGLQVINGYGPTETTTFAATWPITIEDTLNPALPIGLPIRNTQIYLLDANLQPVPDGVIGEIYIAGTGVARGYFGQPQLTTERFVSCPFGEAGRRMYRTGDLARRRADGAIIWLSRTDDQMKIRGFRVEAGEIEAALFRHFGDHLAQAVVLADAPPSAQRLVAYLVPRHGAQLPDATRLRARLSETLPSHMVPTYFVVRDALPLTANGKLDRRALSIPATPVGRTGYRPPRTVTERLLCRLFFEVTGTEQIGLDDSFFAVGGDSLLAMRLISRARANGLALSARNILTHQTPERLAQALVPSERQDTAATPTLDRGAPVFLIPGAGGDIPAMALLRTRCEASLNIVNVDIGEWTDLVEPTFQFEHLIGRVMALITDIAPTGKVRLAGYSLGGQIAWAVAVALEGAGREVEHVMLIDSWNMEDQSQRFFADLDKLAHLTRRDELYQLLRSCAEGEFPKHLARLVGRRLLGRRGAKLLRWLARHRNIMPTQVDYHLSLYLLVSLLATHAAAWSRAFDKNMVLHAPVTLLRAAANMHQAQDLGWQDSSPQLQVVNVAGDHRSMLAADNLGNIAVHFIRVFG